MPAAGNARRFSLILRDSSFSLDPSLSKRHRPVGSHFQVANFKYGLKAASRSGTPDGRTASIREHPADADRQWECRLETFFAIPAKMSCLFFANPLKNANSRISFPLEHHPRTPQELP
jgi:hypothetical protein